MSGVEGAQREDYDECEAGVGRSGRRADCFSEEVVVEAEIVILRSPGLPFCQSKVASDASSFL
jgi:hypothetical protein